MTEMNCPKCGAGLGPRLKALKMVSCVHCGTTSFLQDDQFVLAGQAGVMHDTAQLIRLGQSVTIGGQTYFPRGQARFSYGRGEWDEFWAETQDGGVWISVDEGDVVIQRPLSATDAPKTAPAETLGAEVGADGRWFSVTEVEEAECVALAGSFPEILRVGDRYRFVNCTGNDGSLLSGESGPDSWTWFLGTWVDPFEVTVA
ncbi:DUF4178 domain-containing protein [Fuscibacter oryzae]|nr:DUF4178 domain-containing protein [Fuscibacter oryzae]